MRTDKTTWFLDLAERCARQGTCLRRNYGAVIVDKNNTVVSTGYTGTPAGQVDCLQRGKCWRTEHSIPPGSNYEKCYSVHAEMNALIQAGKHARGSTLYLAGLEVSTGNTNSAYPCFLCAKMIINSGISEIIVRESGGRYTKYLPKTVYDLRAEEAFKEK